MYTIMLRENILGMNKSWIKMLGTSSMYDQRVKTSFEFALQHSSVNDMIYDIGFVL